MSIPANVADTPLVRRELFMSVARDRADGLRETSRLRERPRGGTLSNHRALLGSCSQCPCCSGVRILRAPSSLDGSLLPRGAAIVPPVLPGCAPDSFHGGLCLGTSPEEGLLHLSRSTHVLGTRQDRAPQVAARST